MSLHITGGGLSTAWAAALGWLIEQPKGKGLHLLVSFPAGEPHRTAQLAVDDFLDARRGDNGQPFTVDTVANTIFPQSLYAPSLGEEAESHLYELHWLSMKAQQRISQQADSYFNRLVAYPAGPDQGPFNQLDFVIDRLRSQLGQRGPLSSAYEAGLSHPALDLRVQAPGEDRSPLGFPCLSHLSFTYHADELNLAALYRNHHFIDRAYGNYVGLSRLLCFVAERVDATPGEVVSLSTHADAQIATRGGKRAIGELARDVAAAGGA